MFVVAPLPKSNTSWQRREKGSHGTASSDLFLVGRSHASICIYDYTRLRTQLLCYNVGPQDSWYGAAPMIQIAILEAVGVVTDNTMMTNKLHSADIVLLLQACIHSTTPLHLRAAPC